MNDDILEDGSLQLSKEEGGLSQNASASILRSIKWGRIMLGIAIVGFILQIIAQLMIGQLAQNEGISLSPGATLIVVIFFIALVYGYPIFKFVGFLSKTPQGITNQNQEKFVEGVTNLKSSIKYLGILIFAILALYLIMFLFAILMGGFNSL